MCALKEITGLKNMEMPNAAASDFFYNYPPFMCFLRGFRAVELACNFFIGNLCALDEIPALKSLEMPNAAERGFFFCNYPPVISFSGVFRRVESAPNFSMGSLCVLNEIPALKSLEMPNAVKREFLFP